MPAATVRLRALAKINLDLRGNSPLPARTLFERFLLKLARKNEPARV